MISFVHFVGNRLLKSDICDRLAISKFFVIALDRETFQTL